MSGWVEDNFWWKIFVNDKNETMWNVDFLAYYGIPKSPVACQIRNSTGKTYQVTKQFSCCIKVSISALDYVNSLILDEKHVDDYVYYER